MNKIIKVKIEDREIEVKKLPIGRYAEVLKCVKELPKHLSGLDGIDKTVMLQMLPDLLADSTPDVLNIIAVATYLPIEEVERLGLREITDLVVAIFEVNEYQEVFSKIKKVWGPAKVKTQAIEAN